MTAFALSREELAELMATLQRVGRLVAPPRRLELVDAVIEATGAPSVLYSRMQTVMRPLLVGRAKTGIGQVPRGEAWEFLRDVAYAISLEMEELTDPVPTRPAPVACEWCGREDASLEYRNIRGGIGVRPRRWVCADGLCESPQTQGEP